jgi:hypothetical protein
MRLQSTVLAVIWNRAIERSLVDRATPAVEQPAGLDEDEFTVTEGARCDKIRRGGMYLPPAELPTYWSDFSGPLGYVGSSPVQVGSSPG